MKISLVCAVLTAAALSMTVGGCRKAAAAKERERVTRVGFGRMVKRNFVRRIPVQGTVVPVRFATLSSKTEGALDVLQVDEGDAVKHNGLLFQVDKTNLENQVTVAQRQLEVCVSEVQTATIALQLAKIKCHKANLDFNRADTLRKSKAISQENYESAEVAKKEAECEISRAEALLKIAVAKNAQQTNTLNIARKNLADSVIRAPFDGVITAKLVERNEYVKQGTAILKIEDTEQLEVECFISSVYYPQIVPGRTVAKFRLDGADAGSARVSYRSPSVDPLSRTFKVKILLPRQQKLVSGMLCEVDLILQQREGWGVPADAVMVRDAGREVLFAVDSKTKRAKLFTVKRGIVESEYAEIIGGENLKNETFIVTGQTFVNAGDKVVSNRMEN